MKAVLLVASTILAAVEGGVIAPRQGRPVTSRPSWGSGPDVGQCGLDAFDGHEAEASLFCSSILRGGTATATETYTSRRTTTIRTTITTTLSYGPTRTSTRPSPSSTRTPTPTRTSTPSSTRTPTPSSTRTPTPSSTRTPTPTSSPSPTPTPDAGCGLVGYTKTTAAYFFDSSGTKNTFAACSAFCKSEEKCKGFGYGEANCMLFDIPVNDNVNYNPMSPYTFYNKDCPVELPVKAKRQINISLSIGMPKDISSACSCLITSAPGQTTKTTTVTITSDRYTVTQTATRTVTRGGDDDDWDWKARRV